ncbi:MAG: isochorismatase family protein [Pigmentiphaga sp.]|uniref:isochorismatase family protein n=1 Tax=Pigmentiphaga sp. TaxID=1977564 RepID=UPI0029A39022|nr:isochorismatase family protein [Pigmentiphaga sp.]MDX3906570.1 isochorismatase family protein [Pigmentiphaga sp.]
MSNAIWDPFLTPRDQKVIAASGFGAEQGFGARPAVLVIDVNYNFCGDRPAPILESIKTWRTSCGADAWTSIDAIRPLLAAARDKGLPVLYTTGIRRPDNWDAGAWAWKSTRSHERSITASTRSDGDVIVAEIAPRDTDIVVFKQKPSAFFGTPLDSYLTLLRADSLIVTGATTSGCVRATVVDAFSRNYRVALVEEGCFDRSQASHAVSLFDMHAKYADVVKLERALAHIGRLPAGLFDLPPAN